MKVWSLLSNDAFALLMNKGELICDDISLTDAETDEIFQLPYNFMRKSMIENGLKPQSSNHFPLWFFAKCNGEWGAKPDEYGDEVGVLVEFDIPTSELLLSDFDLWECVLRRDNLNKHYEDDSPSSDSELVNSWKVVFDIEANIDGYSMPIEKRTVQATCWNVTKEQIVQFEPYGENSILMSSSD